MGKVICSSCGKEIDTTVAVKEKGRYFCTEHVNSKCLKDEVKKQIDEFIGLELPPVMFTKVFTPLVRKYGYPFIESFNAENRIYFIKYLSGKNFTSISHKTYYLRKMMANRLSTYEMPEPEPVIKKEATFGDDIQAPQKYKAKKTRKGLSNLL